VPPTVPIDATEASAHDTEVADSPLLKQMNGKNDISVQSIWSCAKRSLSAGILASPTKRLRPVENGTFLIFKWNHV
jgi:hypothetical protein